MQYDERITNDLLSAKRLAYTVFWFGVFGVLLYRWFVTGQSLRETIDIFIVWIGASMVHFFFLASKGVPLFYPVSVSRHEQRGLILGIPLLTMALTAVLVFLRGGSWIQSLVGGGLAFVMTALLYGVYQAVLAWWEHRNI